MFVLWKQFSEVNGHATHLEYRLCLFSVCSSVECAICSVHKNTDVTSPLPSHRLKIEANSKFCILQRKKIKRCTASS